MMKSKQPLKYNKMPEHDAYETCCHISYRYFKSFTGGFKPSRQLKDAIKFTEMKVKPVEIYAMAVASVFVSLLVVLFLFLFLIRNYFNPDSVL